MIIRIVYFDSNFRYKNEDGHFEMYIQAEYPLFHEKQIGSMEKTHGNIIDFFQVVYIIFIFRIYLW